MQYIHWLPFVQRSKARHEMLQTQCSADVTGVHIIGSRRQYHERHSSSSATSRLTDHHEGRKSMESVHAHKHLNRSRSQAPQSFTLTSTSITKTRSAIAAAVALNSHRNQSTAKTAAKISQFSNAQLCVQSNKVLALWFWFWETFSKLLLSSVSGIAYNWQFDQENSSGGVYIRSQLEPPTLMTELLARSELRVLGKTNKARLDLTITAL